MVCLTFCIACQHGQHDGHIENFAPAPEGVMGGAQCPCEGECVKTRTALGEVVRACPVCAGGGCEECGGTGQKVRTRIDAGDGMTLNVSGDHSLSAETRDTLALLARIAYAQMDNEER